MVPLKALAISVPLAAASAWLVAREGARVAELREALGAAEVASRDAGAAVSRLEPHAVERELAALDRRRDVVTRLARARRDRIQGALGLAAAALLVLGAAVLSRVADEVSGERDPGHRGSG